MTDGTFRCGPCSRCRSPLSMTAWHRMDAQWYCDACYGGAVAMHPTPKTLRDYFAGQALMGLIASKAHSLNYQPKDDAEYCYGLADAMLKAREA